MNKRNNKGFSLIELIVVVAIMAVLVGVLAPTYLRYVEKTRLQKDNSAIAEVAQAMKVAAADEKINTAISKVVASGTGETAVAAKTVVISAATDKFTFKKDTYDEDNATDLMLKELAAVIGDGLELKSNTYTGAANEVILKITIENGVPKVTGTNIIEEANGTALTTPKTY